MDIPGPANHTVLEIHAASVQFDALMAVDKVSLQLKGGDLLGLIGPNGAGKTTLLRAAAGLQPLSSGSIHVLGEPLETDVRGHRQIGFTPDTPPAYEDMQVRDFLRFVGYGYDLSHSEIEERTDFWLEKVWLSDKTDQKIKQLSRGMRQRLGIARTLLPNPALILLDEPAAGLDPAGRVQFRQLLSSLRDQGKALIVSSHILSDLADYCTHIAIMSHGQILRYGTVAQISGNHDALRCRYTLHLAHPVPKIQEQLVSIADVEEVTVDRETIILTYHSERAEAAKLLAELVKRGIPVASFSPNQTDLEEVYLRTGIAQVD